MRRAKTTRPRNPRPRMRIDNQTGWDTRDLQKLHRAILRHTGQPMPDFIRVVPTRDQWTTKMFLVGRCHASLKTDPHIKDPDGRWRAPYVVMVITDCAKYDVEFDVGQYAQVFRHEVQHNQGLDHKDMRSWRDFIFGKSLDDITVGPKPVKEKPVKDVVVERHAHAQKKLAEWQAKERRAKARVRKYRTDVRYYENRYPERIEVTT